jgi:UDP-glucose 4-epimerase
MTDGALSGYRGLRVLVTGAAGAIGGNLVRALAAAGVAEVIALDDLSQGVRWNIPKLRPVAFCHGSILDPAALTDAFARRPSVVFHLAALFANQNSIDHPVLDLAVNGQGTLNVLIKAARHGRPRVVFASTSAAAEACGNHPLDDDAPALGHGTPYQITKGLGEQYCRFFYSYHQVPTVRIRFFNSYGPGELPGRYRNVIPNFFYFAKRREPLPIMGTGHQTRDWTFVNDIVDGLLKAGLCEAAVGQSINLGTGRETTVIEVAAEINRLTGNPAGVVYREARTWDRHERRSAAIEKGNKLLQFEPATDISSGLSGTAQWFEQNWSLIHGAARW